MAILARALALMALSAPLAGCFYVHAAEGQLALINRQVPIAKAARDESDPARRWMLREVPWIKRFAREVLLLHPGNSYSGYVATEERGLTYVVTAAEATRFEAHTWWFPIAGEVAYKSHFDERGAMDEAAELQAQGLDVWVGASRAYSTLGVFRDPVVTPMMRGGPIAFVEVLLHEMAHARLYVPGYTDFNEQLASFVGTKGCELYFQAARFAGTGAVEAVEAEQTRQEHIDSLVHGAIDQLEVLYSQNLPRADVLRLRAPILTALESQLQALLPTLPPDELRMNNARLMQYRRYGRDAEYLEQLWAKSGGSFRRFWELVQAYADDLRTQPPPDDSL